MRDSINRLGGLAALALIASTALAASEEMFPPATPVCFVGSEVMPVAAGAPAYSNPAVGVSAIRLERGWPQLAYEETKQDAKGDGRLVSVHTLVTFADAAKSTVRRFDNGRWELLRCKDDVCDAGNYRVERQADGSVLLKMTGGMNVGGGDYPRGASRRLPDGHVYHLSANEMSACH